MTPTVAAANPLDHLRCDYGFGPGETTGEGYCMTDEGMVFEFEGPEVLGLDIAPSNPAPGVTSIAATWSYVDPTTPGETHTGESITVVEEGRLTFVLYLDGVLSLQSEADASCPDDASCDVVQDTWFPEDRPPEFGLRSSIEAASHPKWTDSFAAAIEGSTNGNDDQKCRDGEGGRKFMLIWLGTHCGLVGLLAGGPIGAVGASIACTIAGDEILGAYDDIARANGCCRGERCRPNQS